MSYCCDAVMIIEPFTFCRDNSLKRTTEAVIQILKECAEKSDIVEPGIFSDYTVKEHDGNKGSIFVFAGIFNGLSQEVLEELCAWIQKNEPRIELARVIYWSNENANVDRTLEHQEKWGL